MVSVSPTFNFGCEYAKITLYNGGTVTYSPTGSLRLHFNTPTEPSTTSNKVLLAWVISVNMNNKIIQFVNHI